MLLVLKKAKKLHTATIEKILKKENLPFQDIESDKIEFFFAFFDGDFIGIIGLEQYEEVALLRSMVIFRNFRKNGWGSKLVKQICEKAKGREIKEVFLLTCTAKDFFEHLGFEKIERINVPDKIKSTTEFSSLCPASAVCLKTLIK